MLRLLLLDGALDFGALAVGLVMRSAPAPVDMLDVMFDETMQGDAGFDEMIGQQKPSNDRIQANYSVTGSLQTRARPYQYNY